MVIRRRRMKRPTKIRPERNWAEICFGCYCLQLFWPKIVVRKWLNISNKDSDYSADTEDEEDQEVDFENEEVDQWRRQSRFCDTGGNDAQVDPNAALPRIRRRKSETFRAQYIKAIDLKICVGTWNVGGKLPPDDLDIDDWLHTEESADIYVLGLQEIVPLNVGNIFGAEDSRPVSKWENIIRETLNRIRPTSRKIKSFSDPPSPSKFKPSEDIPSIEEEMLLVSDSDIGEDVHPLDSLDEKSIGFNEAKEGMLTGENMLAGSGVSDCNDSKTSGMVVEQDQQRQFSFPKRLDALYSFWTEDSAGNVEPSGTVYNGTKILSSERNGLSWPELPLHLLSQRVLDRPTSFKSYKSFKASNSFKSYTNDAPSEIASLADIDLEALINRKRKSSFVRIVSKQMVGVFLTIWIRKSLRRHVQNLKVCTVGVGAMGYIGNKGSISVSMSIYQTLFCFICSHLTSGEKDGDELKRNDNVREIHRRTQFHPLSDIGLPKSIHDHEKIIWFGDLNYRINLSYEKAREHIYKKDWSKLVKKDQLVREMKKGRTFDGWMEGNLNFPPTYKYEFNSEKYYGEDPKIGRRTPAWCDRILAYGKGMRLLEYRRTELKLSDHRPVTALYEVEVEVFSTRKLQRALTFTDAEIENEEDISNMGIDVGMSYLRLEEDNISDWQH